jgi:hypothetical protein
MAGLLPAKVENTKPELTSIQEEVTELLADGWTPAKIARKLAPDDEKKRKRLRHRIRRMMYAPAVQERVAANAKAESVAYLGASVQALGRKAAAGRVDAMKLLFESTGYHNTKTQHEHTGEIQINIKGLPRPPRVEDETVISDAEVIEE